MSELGRSIKLPESMDIAFRNLKDAKFFAMDIGGSLTKIAYYSTVPLRRIESSTSESFEGARLHFIKFETKHITQCLDYISQTLVNRSSKLTGNRIKVTGGGAYKYADLIEKKLGMTIEKVDEFKCMIFGCNFLLRNIADEAYIYTRKGNPEYNFQIISPSDNLYPYMLVTIGSGVSIMKVESENKFVRVGGTATGGGTFWGLGKLLTKAEGFDELLALATEGDHRKIDMLVRDIYGEDHDILDAGLPADLIASTFGKAVQDKTGSSQYTDADLARSLLYMISNDIGQIASLYAMLHNIKTIYFGGFFLRHHPVSLHTIGYSVNYWTKGEVQATFLRHEGYLGAIGAFLKGAKEFHAENYSWTENLYGSTCFPPHLMKKSKSEVEVGHLEIDRFETRLSFCPLLANPLNYMADTVDLTRDNDAREYWLKCFEDSLPKFTERAIQSEEFPESEDVRNRASRFKDQFINKLRNFQSHPYAFGNLTVRGLLDLREHCLTEFNFYDPYFKQKQFENDEAFRLFEDHLQKLRKMEWRERQEALARGVLAGNVFDWGAKEVALMMESPKGLDFNEALSFIGMRPWLMDDLDSWIERIKNKPHHKCAAFFIDNSGVDIILGVLPFIEDILQRGTDVLLCANNKPVLNDVTYKELQVILRRAAKFSEVIDEALRTNRLLCLDSGQGSPCLDLARLNSHLVDTMKEREVDLLILEGMGRAIHTNLYTKFKVDSLKLAVLKNKWLAQRLGGEMFSVVFRFEEK